MTRTGENCVADLIAKPALGMASLACAGCTLAELPHTRITSVAPFPGQGAAVDGSLAALGLTFPAPNTFTHQGAARLIWTGRDQAFLTGPAPPDGLARHAALTDQSDGWCRLHLSGDAAADALMRLVPLDLRPQACPPGHSLRSGLNHMNLILVREADHAFTLMVFRSMARTAWHEIAETLTRLAARATLR